MAKVAQLFIWDLQQNQALLLRNQLKVVTNYFVLKNKGQGFSSPVESAFIQIWLIFGDLDTIWGLIFINQTVESNVGADFVLIFAAQLLPWAVMNAAIICFIPLPLAGHEHCLIPAWASFSRSLIAPSSGHLIRSVKWGSRLLGQRFNISRKIRLIFNKLTILLNSPHMLMVEEGLLYWWEGQWF